MFVKLRFPRAFPSSVHDSVFSTVSSMAVNDHRTSSAATYKNKQGKQIETQKLQVLLQSKIPEQYCLGVADRVRVRSANMLYIHPSHHLVVSQVLLFQDPIRNLNLTVSCVVLVSFTCVVLFPPHLGSIFEA